MKRISPWLTWTLVVALVLGATSGLWYFEYRQQYQPLAVGAEPVPSKGSAAALSVKVVHPRRGAMPHLTAQVGSVRAFESVDLYAMVSGYLQSQAVDIGDRVKRAEELAVIAVPEIAKQIDEDEAAVNLAKAGVVQMKAKVSIAKADETAAKAAVVQAKASAKSAAAWVVYRGEQHQRMKDLFATKSIEERLVDEAKEHLEAAKETQYSAQAGIATSDAKVVAASAQIELADANLTAAQAQVGVAQAKLARSRVLFDYSKIAAPFDGVITRRTFFPGAFVRSAEQGGNASKALLTVERTDRFRIVAPIPDRFVPFTRKGQPAIVELDALAPEKFPAVVSRIADSEDPDTRMMHVEIDLANPTGRISSGMFGRVTIVLDKASKELSIPSACLVSKSQTSSEDSPDSVFVVRNDKAMRVRVKLGMDNGVRVEVLHGVQASDDVIYDPPTSLTDGSSVHATPAERK